VKIKLVGYWISTTLIALETLVGGVTDLVQGGTMLVTGPPVAGIIRDLGYPQYVLNILGIWKLLGGVVLLAPHLPRAKEWAYAGIFFELSGAAASHGLHGDHASDMIGPIILAGLTVTSWALRPPSRNLVPAVRSA
jgi:DoxX-like family